MSWQLFLIPGAGYRAERYALRYLKKKGLQLLCRNYACHLGEIDLVMKDKTHLVFVEVRLRKKSNYGCAEETVNHNKRRKLIATALHYTQKECQRSLPNCRFDVVAMTYNRTKSFEVNWIKNAFIC